MIPFNSKQKRIYVKSIILFGLISSLVLLSLNIEDIATGKNEIWENIPSVNDDLSWNLDAISVEGAWQLTNGSKDIIVAIIDSGVDFSLTNLQGVAWNNTNENMTNGIDDDENGYIDDYSGWDFVSDDNTPYGGGSHWHGTHVANWVKEVAPNVTIMDLRILDSSNSFNGSFWPEIVAAVNYSINMGADVINLSIWNYGTSPINFQNILLRAIAEGVVVVGITGNTWDDPSSEGVQYPGKYSEVIATSSISSNGNKSYFSRTGSENELSAPGGSLAPIKGRIAQGTSFAAPHVSGCVALMKSINQSLSPSELRSILVATATDKGIPGRDESYGYGLVNVTNAVRGAAGLQTWNLTIISSSATESTNTFTSQKTPFMTLQITCIAVILVLKRKTTRKQP